MHDPIHTFMDTVLTKEKPLKKFKKIRDKENAEIKRFKERRAREAVEGFQYNNREFIPYALPSGARPSAEDIALAKRLSQQRREAAMRPFPPPVGGGLRAQQFNHPFPGQASQKPPHARSNPPMPKSPPFRPSSSRARSATAPSGPRLHPGMVGLTEYENMSVVPKTYPRVTQTKKEKSAREKSAKDDKIAREKSAREDKMAKEKSAKEAKIAREKREKEERIAKEQIAKEQREKEQRAKEERRAKEQSAREMNKAEEKKAKEKSAKEKSAKKKSGKTSSVETPPGSRASSTASVSRESGPPLSHYPMSDGASLKTELHRGVGDMRRSFVDCFLPSISTKGRK